MIKFDTVVKLFLFASFKLIILNSFNNCSFKIRKNKKNKKRNTGRVNMAYQTHHHVKIETLTKFESGKENCQKVIKDGLEQLDVAGPIIELILLLTFGNTKDKITIFATEVYKGGSKEYEMQVHPFMNGSELLEQLEEWYVVEKWYQNRDWKLKIRKNGKNVLIDRQSCQKDVENLLFNKCHLNIVRPPGVNYYVRTLMGTVLYVVVESDNVLVDEAMKQIEQQSGIPIDSQRLIFSGKQMHRGTTLASYNVERECSFHLVLRLKESKNESDSKPKPSS